MTFETSVDDPYHLPNGSNAHAARKITPENVGEWWWTKNKLKRRKKKRPFNEKSADTLKIVRRYCLIAKNGFFFIIRCVPLYHGLFSLAFMDRWILLCWTEKYFIQSITGKNVTTNNNNNNNRTNKPKQMLKLPK